ncbi:hypothetical protein DKX38_028213 [Salix brachista]|uniref:Uncharacterized protein n=1 Tax=Salix brachista TaxID=2182728 RepID=A0A5N5JGR2_9ROSI|nr:hypothetical protein DKX38_028213 [Salix brachista]
MTVAFVVTRGDGGRMYSGVFWSFQVRQTVSIRSTMEERKDAELCTSQVTCMNLELITRVATEPPFDGAETEVEGWLFVGGSIAADDGDSVAGVGSGTKDGWLAA